jgi:uncharacterized protein
MFHYGGFVNAPATPSTARHGLVDALRGLALLGILIVNLEFIASDPKQGWNDFTSTGDLIGRWIGITFFQLKSYLVFALLFGYGVAIMSRSRPGQRFAPRYLRRMLLLLVLGVLHAVFFFVGDILASYAILGTALLAVCHWSDRRLLKLASWLYAAALAVVVLVAIAIAVSPSEAVSSSAVYANGSFLEVARERVDMLPVALLVIGVLNWLSIAATFCVGIVLGRSDVLSKPARHLVAARRAFRVCAPIGFGLCGVAGAVILTGDERTVGMGPAVGLVLENVGGPIAVVGVVAGVIVASQRRWWRPIERSLTPGGSSSLSAYVGESVIASFLFCGYGLGLIGDVGPLAILPVAVVIYATLEVLARLWLRRYRQGPLEWLLRSVTYWRPQVLRRPVPRDGSAQSLR